MDGDGDHVGRAFDLDLGHARVGHPGHDVLADAYVLDQQVRVFLASGEPASVPVFDRPLADLDAQAEADRVSLLSHQAPFSATTTVMWLERFRI